MILWVFSVCFGFFLFTRCLIFPVNYIYLEWPWAKQISSLNLLNLKLSQKKRHKSDDEVNNRKAKVLRDQGETTATHEKWVIDFYKVHCLLVINKLAEGWNDFYNSTKEHDVWHLSIIQQSTIKPALFLQTPKAFWHLYFYKTVVAVMLYPLLYCNDIIII